jgi:hypothetical protein
LSSRVGSQPGQHRETLFLKNTYTNKISKKTKKKKGKEKI